MRRGGRGAHRRLVYGLAALLVGWAVHAYGWGLRVVGGTSMEGTLLAGDLVLVARSPLWASPSYERGDVVVFRGEDDERRKTEFVKRIVGAPGDSVRAVGSEMWVNGKAVPLTGAMQRSWVVELHEGAALEATALYRAGVKEIREAARGVVLRPATQETATAIAGLPGVRSVRPCIDCRSFDLQVYVPRRGADASEGTGTTEDDEDYYFVAGDNRDESEDSRTWGPVVERRIVGKVIVVLASWDPVRKRIRVGRVGRRVAPVHRAGRGRMKQAEDCEGDCGNACCISEKRHRGETPGSGR